MAESSNGEIDHFITIFQNAPSLEEKLQLFCERNDVKSFIQEHLGLTRLNYIRGKIIGLFFSDKPQ